MTEPDQYVGPQALPPERLEAAVALANRVFRQGRGADGDMAREFPTLFCRDRMEQLRTITCGDEPVSLVGMVAGDVVLLGCPLRVVCIGSVCTDEAHRQAGLAGRCLDDAVRCAIDGGASLMLISGGRSLYRRRGAFSCGRFVKYALPADALPPAGEELEIVEVTSETAGEALRLFEAEPIRFRRCEADYATLVLCGGVMDRPGGTYLARRDGEAAAVVSVNAPRGDEPNRAPTVSVRELAGERRTALGLLSKLADHYAAGSVEIDAYPTDVALKLACAAPAGTAERVGSPYTLKLLDADRLWSAFRPLLAERIGASAAAKLRIAAEADELSIHGLAFESAGERFEAAGAREVTAALFGSTELDPLAGAAGALGRTLRRALPLPLPLYGLNYI